MNHIVSINILEKRGSQSPTYKSTHKNTEGERERQELAKIAHKHTQTKIVSTLKRTLLNMSFVVDQNLNPLFSQKSGY